MGDSYKGKCFCGAVEIEATGTPAVQGYCHCEDCKSWSAVVAVKDGLPKYKDLPAEFGGSGETLTE
jgi:hypothetical protein